MINCRVINNERLNTELLPIKKQKGLQERIQLVTEEIELFPDKIPVVIQRNVAEW